MKTAARIGLQLHDVSDFLGGLFKFNDLEQITTTGNGGRNQITAQWC
jgi:hypothetical protein